MLLTELREAIESGKTAKLHVPKTHEHGIEITISVVKQDSQFIWQRHTIESLSLPAKTTHYESWEKLLETLQGSMQLRDSTWEIEHDAIETSQEVPVSEGK